MTQIRTIEVGNVRSARKNIELKVSFVLQRKLCPKIILFFVHISQRNYEIAGYILADSGYDVWMGNARGSIYSKRHVRLSTDKAKYWQFR